MGCKGTTKIWNVQDFQQKKYRLCLYKRICFLERLSFAQRCERSFGGNPPHRGRGVPKLIHFCLIISKKESRPNGPLSSSFPGTRLIYNQLPPLLTVQVIS